MIAFPTDISAISEVDKNLNLSTSTKSYLVLKLNVGSKLQGALMCNAPYESGDRTIITTNLHFINNN